MRDHQNPGEGLASIGVESSGLLPDFHEDFLGDFFTLGGVADDPPDQAEDGGRHGVIQGLKSGFVGFANFRDVLADPNYLHSLYVTVVFSVLTALLSMVVALALATAADKVVRGQTFYRTLLIWPYAVAPAVAGLLWLFMFNPSMGSLAYIVRRAGFAWDPLLNGDQAMALVVVASSVLRREDPLATRSFPATAVRMLPALVAVAVAFWPAQRGVQSERAALATRFESAKRQPRAERESLRRHRRARGPEGSGRSRASRSRRSRRPLPGGRNPASAREPSSAPSHRAEGSRPGLPSWA